MVTLERKIFLGNNSRKSSYKIKTINLLGENANFHLFLWNIEKKVNKKVEGEKPIDTKYGVNIIGGEKNV